MTARRTPPDRRRPTKKRGSVSRWKIGPSRRRAQWAFVFAVLLFAFAVFRMVSVQLWSGVQYRADGVQQRESTVKVAAARGTIFDRDGNEMAITVPATSIYANPKAVIDPKATAHVLAQMLGIDADREVELATKLSDRTQSFV